MKKFIHYLLFLTAAVSLFAACDKVDALPSYGAGKAVELTASASTVAPIAADSNKVALTFAWTYPDYATDSSRVKYTLQIDSAGKNFARPYTMEVIGKSTVSLTAKELNAILLGKGYAFNAPADMEARIISSYVNNNEALNSNTIKIRMTAYKTPPKVALPASGKLFIVGNATQGGWNNPVPAPAQEFARVDETTFAGVFRLNGGMEFLLLPVNGDWTNKYAVNSTSLPGLNGGGDFGYNFSSNFPSPTATGFYKIVVDFQTGKFSVTPFTQQHGLPANLYIVGGATPGGWSNPVPEPAQKLTRLNASQFEVTLALKPGEKYLFLPENGSWAAKFGDDGTSTTKLAGKLKPEGGDISAPDVAGNYKITVDFNDNSYKLVKL